MALDQVLVERLRALEDMQRMECDDNLPTVCVFCFSVYDLAGCLCGRVEWTSVGSAIIELRQRLDRIRERLRAHNAVRETVNLPT